MFYVPVYSSLYRLNKEVSTAQDLVLSTSLDNGLHQAGDKGGNPSRDNPGDLPIRRLPITYGDPQDKTVDAGNAKVQK